VGADFNINIEYPLEPLALITFLPAADIFSRVKISRRYPLRLDYGENFAPTRGWARSDYTLGGYSTKGSPNLPKRYLRQPRARDTASANSSRAALRSAAGR